MPGCCRCGCWPSGPACLPAGLSAAMRARGSSPLYDRGQLLADLALVLIAGGEAISDFQALAHLAPLTGPVPSTPTVWRALIQARDLQLARAQRRRNRVPPALVEPARGPAGGVPVAEGRLPVS